jgi:hypothetical protein
LYAKCVVPSFILAIFASGSVRLTQSALEFPPFLACPAWS